MEAVLATFLSPFLSFLLNKGQDAAEEAINRFGGAAWEHAKAVWERLRPRVEGKEAAREAAQDVAATPDDELARGALQLQLKKLLADDPDLAQVLSELLDKGRENGIMADNGSVVITGGVHADRGAVAAGRDITISEGGLHTGGAGT